MDSGLLWRSNVSEWDKISVESYKFIIEQAKERLNETIEESQLITKRGMAILFSYLTVLSGLLGYIFSDKFKKHSDVLTIIITIIIALLSIYVFTLLFALILPKNSFHKGSPPKEIFFAEVFEDLTPEDGFKNLLCNEVERIQDKIERMQLSNKKRIGQYRSTLKFSLCFVATAIFTIVKTIYSHF